MNSSGRRPCHTADRGEKPHHRLWQQPILDAVDLAIRAGEIVTLIGPKGSGKTNLVRALLGLVPVASGRILRNTNRIGYVPQSFARDRSLPLTALRFLTSFGAGSENDAREAPATAGAR